MKTYKELETYQLAFNLAIKVYNLNISLPKHLLIRFGNRLRWSSLKTKDMIAEAYPMEISEKTSLQTLEEAGNLCNEIISHLISIRKAYQRVNSVDKLIIGYQTLQSKISNSAQDIDKIFPHTEWGDISGSQGSRKSNQYSQVS